MALTGSEFVDRVKYYSEAWWPARNLVEDAVAKRFEVRICLKTPTFMHTCNHVIARFMRCLLIFFI